MSERFKNPILDINAADPTVYYSNGVYYLFYTGAFDNKLYTSTDMVNWKPGNQAISDKAIGQLREMCKEVDSDECLYAPTVIQLKNMYIMYVSLTHKCMVALVSTSPDGPFHFYNDKPYILLDEKNTNLDITFEDSCVSIINGVIHMIWGSHGRIYKVKLQSNGLYYDSKEKPKHIAGSKLWPNNVYEGAYVYYRNGYYYLFCAKGHYNSAEKPYMVTVGRSKSIDGPFRNKAGLRLDCGFGTVIMKAKDMSKYLGPGHTGEIFEDKNGQTYIYYQRQLKDREHYRPLFLQKIYWDKKGWPYFTNDAPVDEEDLPKI